LETLHSCSRDGTNRPVPSRRCEHSPSFKAFRQCEQWWLVSLV
jgi:hypothetical protein